MSERPQIILRHDWATSNGDFAHHVQVTDEHLKVTYGPATAVGLTYGPIKRHLPRLKLTKQKRYWAARITAQDNSYMEAEATTRRGAIIKVIRFWRHQRWPIYTQVDR